jgi:hypothetical protein
MELRFGRAGLFGALAYSYLLYQLSEGQMTSSAAHAGFHWMVVYWLAATAFGVGWLDHENLDWVRLDRALDGRDLDNGQSAPVTTADLAAAE